MRYRAQPKELRAFAEAWKGGEKFSDAMLPLVSVLDQDRRQAATNSFISLMATSHSLRHRTLFPDWAGCGEVCGEIDLDDRPGIEGGGINDAIVLANRIDEFIRDNAEAFNFSETTSYVDVDETHALVVDGTIKFIPRKDD